MRSETKGSRSQEDQGTKKLRPPKLVAFDLTPLLNSHFLGQNLANYIVLAHAFFFSNQSEFIVHFRRHVDGPQHQIVIGQAPSRGVTSRPSTAFRQNFASHQNLPYIDVNGGHKVARNGHLFLALY